MRLAAPLIVALLATGAPALQVSGPTKERVFVAEKLAELTLLKRGENVLPARPLSEVVQLKLDKGQLLFELIAADVGEEAIIPLQGVQGVCRVQRFVHLASPSEAMRLAILIVDPKRARSVEINQSNLGRFMFDVTFQSADEVAITTQMNAPVPGALLTDDTDMRFYVQVHDETGARSTPSIEREAETIAKLMDENHAQLLESIGEGLRHLRAMHVHSGLGEREAQHLLVAGDVPDDRVQREIVAAVESMKTDPDAGEKRLQSLLKEGGPPAASALARLSRESWSADQTMRIDNLLAPLLLEESAIASHLNRQPYRLVDLLYWPKEEIRRAALARLTMLTERPIEIDPSADPYQLSDQIESLRAELTPAK